MINLKNDDYNLMDKIMRVDPKFFGELSSAISKNNKFRRGKKNGLETWKVMFGVYLSYHVRPTFDTKFILSGREWKLTVEGFRANASIDFSKAVPVYYPAFDTSVYSGDRAGPLQRILSEFSFDGDEDAFNRDMSMLLMFRSEWDKVPSPHEAKDSNYEHLAGLR